MPAATPIRIRRVIVERRASGESYAAIARDLAMPYVTVRGIDRHYQQTGQLEPSYEGCRQTGVRKPAAIYGQAVALKRAHPGWGAGLIWVELAEVFDEAALPSVRSLQRWFRRAGVAAARREPTQRETVRRGKAAHEVWALDAKEQIELQDGRAVSWLTISDEGSGAILSTTLFPLKRWTQVDPLAVKACLQAALVQWGKPERLRMDNGTPWGTQSRLPSALGLWLVGLGIDPVYGRPARSTDNGVVERDHGVLAQWVELDTCADFDDCQRRLGWAEVTQRERYRAPNGYTRAQAFPALYTNPRRYALRQEPAEWELARVMAYLAQFPFRRKVGKFGQVTLFANSYSVGRAYSRQLDELQLDATTGEWVIRGDTGQEIQRHPNRELTYEQISQLTLAKRRKHSTT